MSDKFYKCPYCDAKFSRSTIGNHIELNHEELVPKGMTANQVGFNTLCFPPKEPAGTMAGTERYCDFTPDGVQ